MCQKLAKSVDVHCSYSVQRQCRFFETQCIVKGVKDFFKWLEDSAAAY